VHNHFPDEGELFGACQAHWMTLHPLPDVGEAFLLPNPADRVKAVLSAYYGWYRETGPMAENVQRDRGAVPPLDALLAQTADAGLAQLADALSAGFPRRGRTTDRRRALIRLALDFWTWRRLDREGLDDSGAAALMADTIAAHP
jgi:hypothetical protein